jgi:hypothetical protein
MCMVQDVLNPLWEIPYTVQSGTIRYHTRIVARRQGPESPTTGKCPQCTRRSFSLQSLLLHNDAPRYGSLGEGMCTVGKTADN